MKPAMRCVCFLGFLAVGSLVQAAQADFVAANGIKPSLWNPGSEPVVMVLLGTVIASGAFLVRRRRDAKGPR